MLRHGTASTAANGAIALNYVLNADAPPRAFSPKVVASVEAIDKQTVRITTAAPSVLLPYRLAAPNTGVLAPAAVNASAGSSSG